MSTYNLNNSAMAPQLEDERERRKKIDERKRNSTFKVLKDISIIYLVIMFTIAYVRIKNIHDMLINMNTTKIE